VEVVAGAGGIEEPAEAGVEVAARLVVRRDLLGGADVTSP